MIISREEAVNLLTNDGNLLKDDEAAPELVKSMREGIEEEVIAEIVDDLVSPVKPILQVEKGTHRIIPPIFRELIAIQSHTTGNAASVARAFGISAEHARELKAGQVSSDTYLKTNDPRASDIEHAKALEAALGKVRNKALDKIYASMDAIDDSLLPDEQPKTLALIAANLSRVVSSTMRDKRDGPVVNVQTVFYSPEKTKKEQYDVIDV